MAHRTTNWLTGATAGIGGVTAAEAMAVLTRGPSLVDAAGRLVVDLGPRPVIDLAVRLLRSSDKPVIRGAVVASVVAAGGALAPSVNRAGTRTAVLSVAGGLAAFLLDLCSRVDLLVHGYLERFPLAAADHLR